MRNPLVILSALLLAIVGCAHQKPSSEFKAGPLKLADSHFVGTPLSGPTTRPKTAFDPLNSPEVRVRFLALERMPLDVGQPLGTQVRLIAAERRGSPLLPSARLTSDVRLIDSSVNATLDSSRAGRSIVLGESIGALPDSVTAVFSASAPGDPNSADDSKTARSVRIDLHRLPQPGARAEVEVALTVEDTPKHPSENAPLDALQKEAVIFNRPARTEDQFMLVIPFTFGQAFGLALQVEIKPASADESHRQVVARCTEQAIQSAQHVASRPRLAPLTMPDVPGFLVAVVAMSRDETRRPALAFLASQANVPIVEDLALVGSDAFLADFVKRLNDAASQLTPDATAETWRWLLERIAFLRLSELLETNEIPPELAAALTRHAGEAGRRAASIQEAIRAATDVKSFENRLIAENLILLEDASPAARVRAFDWLATRQRAPRAYDPLGTPRQRREALEKAFSTARNGN